MGGVMSKPVTELWNAAHEVGQTCDMHTGLERRLADALDAIQKRGLLALLDLVATSGRLGLVRWVVGLSEEETEALGEALSDYQKCVEGGGDSESQAIVGRLMDRWDFALSGGEGGAKAVHFPEKCGARGPNTGGLCEARMMVPHREHYAPATNEMWPAGKTREEPPVCTSNGCASCGFSGGCDQEDEGQPPPPMWGGEGEAKCPDCQGQGYHEVEHVSETERVLDQEKCSECDGTGEAVKDAPCPKCTAGAAQALEASQPEDEIRALETRLAGVREKIRSYDGGDRPSSPPMALLREEQDFLKSIEAKEDERDAAKPTPTILPAGKPPPFLRVGMVLAGKRDHSWTVEAIHQDARAVLRGGGEVRVRAITAILEQCILFEDFVVEGES